LKRLPVLVKWFVVLFLQLIASQVITFAGSFFFPNMEQPGVTSPIPFAVMLGIAMTAGFFLVGWFAIRSGWLEVPKQYTLRLVCTFIGVILPLFVGILLVHTLPAGSPFFGISFLTGLLGFHLPTWIKK